MDELYVVARGVLLDALEAFGDSVLAGPDALPRRGDAMTR